MSDDHRDIVVGQCYLCTWSIIGLSGGGRFSLHYVHATVMVKAYQWA